MPAGSFPNENTSVPQNTTKAVSDLAWSTAKRQAVVECLEEPVRIDGSSFTRTGLDRSCFGARLR
jgi:hypothetical protein